MLTHCCWPGVPWRLVADGLAGRDFRPCLRASAGAIMSSDESGREELMYKSLLVAVDHSEITERVLGAARDLASLSHGEVWVLHLREREVMPKAGLMARESPDEAQMTVDAAVEELTAAGITARGEVRNTIFGYAAREIVADAIEHDAGVIVMGSRGRGDLAGLVLGSTAHKVLHLADRPVLVVR